MTTLFLNGTRKITAFNNFNKLYCQIRWTRRSPIKVIPSEEYDETEDVQISKRSQKPHFDTDIKKEGNKSGTSFVKNHRSQDIAPLTISKSSHTRKQSKKTSVDMLETIIDSDGNFVYTKLKDNDSKISSILAEVKSKKERNKNDLILLEGKRLIVEALIAGCKLEYILFSRLDEVEYLKPYLPKIGAKLYKMPYREMQMWSGLTTNPGIMGIFKVPDLESSKTSSESLPITVICDNIREANNLGAVLRTCGGVGCKEIILTKGCVNVWDSKVLRSACGAHFKLQIKRKVDLDKLKENLPSSTTIYIADNNTISTDTDKKFSNENDLLELVQAVPVLPYYGVDFSSSSHIVVIIGGETEGISEDSYKLAEKFNGVRLNVPLSNSVESLNTGVALGIIVFEIKRQLTSHGIKR